MVIRNRWQLSLLGVLSCSLAVFGCGGPPPNTVAPPAIESNFVSQGEQMRKSYGGPQANQAEIDKAIQEAKAKAAEGPTN